MNKWQKFEEDCNLYLNDKFGKYANFEKIGSSDSTVSDIRVSSNYKSFFIEVKKSPAQSGQFVILNNKLNSKFILSEKNKNNNKYAKEILKHINDNYKKYLSAGTSGIPLKFPDCQNIFLNYIVSNLRNKNVKFIITNKFIIFPIEDFSDHFEITATVRGKGSGSAKLPKKDKKYVKEYLLEHYNIINFTNFNDKTCIIIPSAKIDNDIFEIGDNRFKLSSLDKKDNYFEIRKLSHTKNLTVIFSIKAKESTGWSNNRFKKFLKDYFNQ